LADNAFELPPNLAHPRHRSDGYLVTAPSCAIARTANAFVLLNFRSAPPPQTSGNGFGRFERTPPTYHRKNTKRLSDHLKLRSIEATPQMAAAIG
jgi:hypothetical protein